MARQSTAIFNASISNRGIAYCATDSQVATELGAQDTFVRASALRFSPTTVGAWVNFNGTGTVAIRDSYNVSSITDNGVGMYSLNFNNSFTSANYSVAGMGGNDTGANARNECTVELDNAGLATNSCKIGTRWVGAGADLTHVCVSVMGRM